jgi:hypothetical protein
MVIIAIIVIIVIIVMIVIIPTIVMIMLIVIMIISMIVMIIVITRPSSGCILAPVAAEVHQFERLGPVEEDILHLGLGVESVELEGGQLPPDPVGGDCIYCDWPRQFSSDSLNSGYSGYSG